MPISAARSSPKPNPFFAQEEVVGAASAGFNYASPRRNYAVDIYGLVGLSGDSMIHTNLTFNGGQSYTENQFDATSLFADSNWGIQGMQADQAGGLYFFGKGYNFLPARIYVGRSSDDGRNWTADFTFNMDAQGLGTNWHIERVFGFPVGDGLYTIADAYKLPRTTGLRRMLWFQNGTLINNELIPDPDSDSRIYGVNFAQFSAQFQKGYFVVDQTLDQGGEELYKVDSDGISLHSTLPTGTGLGHLQSFAANMKTGATYFGRDAAGTPQIIYSNDHGATFSAIDDDTILPTMFNVSRENDFISQTGEFTFYERFAGGLPGQGADYSPVPDGSQGVQTRRGRRTSRFMFVDGSPPHGRKVDPNEGV